jgi:hypothetical protein
MGVRRAVVGEGVGLRSSDNDMRIAHILAAAEVWALADEPCMGFVNYMVGEGIWLRGGASATGVEPCLAAAEV